MGYDDASFRYFVFDVGLYLKEAALEAKASRDSLERGTPAGEFASGRALAYYEVLSTLKQTLEGFQIPASAMQLDDLDPDRDLL